MDSEDKVTFSPSSSSIHVQCMSTPATVTTTAEIIMHTERRQEVCLLSDSAPQVEEDQDMISARSDHLNSQQDPESLVTADDVSSSMFSEDVNTAIEAPKAAPRIRSGSEEEVCSGSKAAKGRVHMLCKFFETKAHIQDSNDRVMKKGEPKEVLPVH